MDINGFVDVPTGKNSSLQIATRKSISDLVQTPIYDEYFNRITQQSEVQNTSENTIATDEEFNFYDTSLRWLYKIDENNTVRINFINVANELQFNERANVSGEEESRESNISQNSIAGAIYFDRRWNNKRNFFERRQCIIKLLTTCCCDSRIWFSSCPGPAYLS